MIYLLIHFIFTTYRPETFWIEKIFFRYKNVFLFKLIKGLLFNPQLVGEERDSYISHVILASSKKTNCFIRFLYILFFYPVPVIFTGRELWTWKWYLIFNKVILFLLELPRLRSPRRLSSAWNKLCRHRIYNIYFIQIFHLKYFYLKEKARYGIKLFKSGKQTIECQAYHDLLRPSWIYFTL